MLIGKTIMSLLSSSKYGGETYHAYTRMRSHIQKYNTIDKRFREKFSRIYCTNTGVKMAAKEAGLENLI